MSNVNQDPVQRGGGRRAFFQALTPKTPDAVVSGQDVAVAAVESILNTPFSRRVAVALGTAVVIDATNPNLSVVRTVLACNDGSTERNDTAETPRGFQRLPVSMGDKVIGANFGWQEGGPFPYRGGYNGFDRIVATLPRTALKDGPNVWELNSKPGLATVYTEGFCGTNEQVEAWVASRFVDSHVQASRSEDGGAPDPSEVSVVRFIYEGGRVIQRKSGTLSIEDVAERFDLSFRDPATGRRSNQALHGEK